MSILDQKQLFVKLNDNRYHLALVQMDPVVVVAIMFILPALTGGWMCLSRKIQ
jgi:hypothetical protein